jgi:hypothetical protein
MRGTDRLKRQTCVVRKSASGAAKMPVFPMTLERCALKSGMAYGEGRAVLLSASLTIQNRLQVAGGVADASADDLLG